MTGAGSVRINAINIQRTLLSAQKRSRQTTTLATRLWVIKTRSPLPLPLRWHTPPKGNSHAYAFTDVRCAVDSPAGDDHAGTRRNRGYRADTRTGNAQHSADTGAGLHGAREC